MELLEKKRKKPFGSDPYSTYASTYAPYKINSNNPYEHQIIKNNSNDYNIDILDNDNNSESSQNDSKNQSNSNNEYNENNKIFENIKSMSVKNILHTDIDILNYSDVNKEHCDLLNHPDLKYPVSNDSDLRQAEKDFAGEETGISLDLYIKLC